MMTEYLNNPQLTTIKPEYLGNEIRDGKFRNYQASTPPHWKQILRWQFSYRPQKTLNRYSRYHVPLIEDPQLFCNNVPKISWLGHASFLLTLNGKNIIIDSLRSKSVRPEFLNVDDQLLEIGDKKKWNDQMDSTLEVQSIVESLKKLKHEYREVITLRYIDDMTLSEISEITGKSAVTVRVTLHRALKKIKELLEKQKDTAKS
jgi:hypothetical protein